MKWKYQLLFGVLIPCLIAAAIVFIAFPQRFQDLKEDTVSMGRYLLQADHQAKVDDSVKLNISDPTTRIYKNSSDNSIGFFLSGAQPIKIVLEKNVSGILKVINTTSASTKTNGWKFGANDSFSSGYDQYRYTIYSPVDIKHHGNYFDMELGTQVYSLDFTDICSKVYINKTDSSVMDARCNYEVSKNQVIVDFYSDGDIDPTITGDVSYASNNTNVTQEYGFAHLNTSKSSFYTSLVAYYTFDKVNNTRVFDMTEKNNDGTLQSGMNTSVQPNISQIYLDYVTADSNNDQVNFGSPASLDDLNLQGGNGMTLTAWIYPRSTGEGSEGTIADKNNVATTANGAWRWGLGIVAGSRTLTFEKSYSTTTLNAQSVGAIPINTWTFVAVTWNGSSTSSSISFYVNSTSIANQAAGTQNGAGSLLNDSAVAFCVSDCIGNRVFDGGIDEVMVFNTTLNQTQINQIFNNQSSRFATNGTMLFQGINLGTNTTANITLTRYQHFGNSTIQAQFSNAGTVLNAINFSNDGNITNYDISSLASKTNLNLTLIFWPDNSSTKFYTPLVIGNITIDGFGTGGGLLSGVARTYINQTRSNFTIRNGTSLFLNGTVFTGDFGSVNLTIDTTQLNFSTSVNVTYTYLFSTPGTFKIATNYSGTTNYTAAFEQWNVTVYRDEVDITNFTASPASGVTYSAGAVYRFNATVANTTALDKVIIEFNGTNYTVPQSSVAGVYNISFTDLGAGTYNYYWRANSTLGYVNITSVQTYVINKSAGSIALLLNSTAGDINVTYPSQVNASATSSTGQTISLYRNGTDVISLNSLFENLGVNYYNFTATAASNQNYTQVSITRNANVTKGIPNGSISLSPASTVTYPTSTTATGSEGNPGDGDMTYTLYRGGVAVTNPETITLAAGTYTYTYNVTTGTNWTLNSSLDSEVLTVNQGTGVVQTFINQSRSNISVTNGTTLFLNGSLLTGQFGSLNLTINGTQLNFSTTGNITYTYLFSSPGLFRIGTNYSGNTNYTKHYEEWNVSVSSVVDTTKPLYFNITTDPLNSASYQPGGNYSFNITWTDDAGIAVAIIEFNGTNYSMTQIGNVFNRTFTDLGAGTYQYYFFANDSAGNRNVTNVFNYSVNRTTVSLSVGLSPAATVTYPTSTTATGSSCPAQLSCTLYRNATSVANPNTVTLGVRTYIYNYTTVGNANYTASNFSATLTVNKGTGVVNTYVNEVRSDISINNGSTIDLNGTLVTGLGSISLYRNGTLINQGTSPLFNASLFGIIGTFPISTNYSGNENYTAATEQWIVTVSLPAPAQNYTNFNCNGNLTLITSFNGRPYGRLCYIITNNRPFGRLQEVLSFT